MCQYLLCYAAHLSLSRSRTFNSASKQQQYILVVLESGSTAAVCWSTSSLPFIWTPDQPSNLLKPAPGAMFLNTRELCIDIWLFNSLHYIIDIHTWEVFESYDAIHESRFWLLPPNMFPNMTSDYLLMFQMSSTLQSTFSRIFCVMYMYLHVHTHWSLVTNFDLGVSIKTM